VRPPEDFGVFRADEWQQEENARQEIREKAGEFKGERNSV
jgi:hypothetical protein